MAGAILAEEETAGRNDDASSQCTGNEEAATSESSRAVPPGKMLAMGKPTSVRMMLLQCQLNGMAPGPHVAGAGRGPRPPPAPRLPTTADVPEPVDRPHRAAAGAAGVAAAPAEPSPAPDREEASPSRTSVAHRGAAEESVLKRLDLLLQELTCEEDDEEAPALLRRVSACRQGGGPPEEELRLATAALEAAAGDSAATLSALCAVAEAHLALESLARARAAVQQALAHARGACARDPLAEAQALAASVQVHLLSVTSEEGLRAAREVLSLLRELGATWAEVASLMSAAEWRVTQAGNPQDALSSAEGALEVAREAQSRWAVALELCVLVRARLEQEGRREALKAISDLLRVCAAHGVVWREAELSALERALPTTGATAVESFAASAGRRLALVRELSDSERAEAMALLTAAHARVAAGAYEEGLQFAEEAAAAFQEVGHREGVGVAWILASEVHLLTRPSSAEARQKAFAKGQEALQLFRDLRHGKGEAAALQKVARALLSDGQAEAAQRAALDALQLARRLGDRRHEGLCFDALARAAARQCPERALQLGTEAGRLLCDVEDRLAVASLLLLLSGVHLARFALDAALSAGRDAMATFRELGHKAGEAAAGKAVAEAQLAIDCPSKALKAAAEAEEPDNHSADAPPTLQLVAKTQPMSKETAAQVAMLKRSVEAHLTRSDREGKEDALQTVVDALSNFRDADNAHGEAQGLAVLASVYVARGEPEAAVSVVQDAVPLFRELGDKRSELELLHAIINSALIREGTEHTEEALRAVKTALAVCAQSDYKRGQAAMLLASFKILMARDKPERAMQAADEALKVFKGLNDPTGEAEVVHLTAKAHVERDDPKKGVISAQRALALFREQGDKDRERAALHTLVEAHAARGDHALAAEVSKEALALCRGLGDKTGEATTLQLMCKMHLATGSREGATSGLQVAKEALLLFQQAEDKRGQGSSTHLMAKAHLLKGEAEEAARLAKDAHKLACQARDRLGQAEALATVGEASLAQGHTLDALGAASEALDLFRELGRGDSEALALRTVIEARLANAEPSEALRLAKEAHQRAKRLGNAKGEAAALHAVASVCIHIRAPVEATQALAGAQAIYRKLKDRPREAGVLVTAVNAHWLTGDAEDALRAAKDARAIYREVKDRRQEATVLELMASIHTECGEASQALDAAKAMASVLEELGDRIAMAQAKQTVAGLYLEKGDPSEALRAARDAASVYEAAGEALLEGHAWLLAAQAYMERHAQLIESVGGWDVDHSFLPKEDPREAVKVAIRARALFRRLNDVPLEMEALKLMANAHLRKGDYRDALRMADEGLMLARKTKDKAAEAQSQLLCAQMYAMQCRWPPAFRAVEAARALFEEIGHEEGKEAAEEYQVTVRNAARENGYFEERSQRGIFQDTASPFGGGRKVGGASAAASQLYQRKAFPWTKQQGAEGA